MPAVCMQVVLLVVYLAIAVGMLQWALGNDGQRSTWQLPAPELELELELVLMHVLRMQVVVLVVYLILATGMLQWALGNDGQRSTWQLPAPAPELAAQADWCVPAQT